MSIFVVVWHTGGAGHSLINSKTEHLEHVFTVSDFVNFHLLLLAVPTFIFMSIFLYATKPIATTRLRKSLVRGSILLTFWPSVMILYIGGYQAILAMVPDSPVGFIYVVLRAGNTNYYFFSSLMVCLFTAHIFLLLNPRVKLLLFLFSVALLASLPELTRWTRFPQLSAYWSPLNFIAITFAAVLTAQNKDLILRNRRALLALSFFLYVLFSVLEWRFSVGEIFFAGQGYALPIYTRTSLMFAVFALIVIALDPRIKSVGLVKYMATYSLGLYCLHPFLISPARKFVAMIVQNETVSLCASRLLVVLSSYAIAMFLRRYYLRDEVVV